MICRSFQTRSGNSSKLLHEESDRLSFARDLARVLQTHCENRSENEYAEVVELVDTLS